MSEQQPGASVPQTPARERGIAPVIEHVRAGGIPLFRKPNPERLALLRQQRAERHGNTEQAQVHARQREQVRAEQRDSALARTTGVIGLETIPQEVREVTQQRVRLAREALVAQQDAEMEGKNAQQRAEMQERFRQQDRVVVVNGGESIMVVRGDTRGYDLDPATGEMTLHTYSQDKLDQAGKPIPDEEHPGKNKQEEISADVQVLTATFGTRRVGEGSFQHEDTTVRFLQMSENGQAVATHPQRFNENEAFVGLGDRMVRMRYTHESSYGGDANVYRLDIGDSTPQISARVHRTVAEALDNGLENGNFKPPYGDGTSRDLVVVGAGGEFLNIHDRQGILRVANVTERWQVEDPRQESEKPKTEVSGSERQLRKLRSLTDAEFYEATGVNRLDAQLNVAEDSGSATVTEDMMDGVDAALYARRETIRSRELDDTQLDDPAYQVWAVNPDQRLTVTDEDGTHTGIEATNLIARRVEDAVRTARENARESRTNFTDDDANNTAYEELIHQMEQAGGKISEQDAQRLADTWYRDGAQTQLRIARRPEEGEEREAFESRLRGVLEGLHLSRDAINAEVTQEADQHFPPTMETIVMGIAGITGTPEDAGKSRDKVMRDIERSELSDEHKAILRTMASGAFAEIVRSAPAEQMRMPDFLRTLATGEGLTQEMMMQLVEAIRSNPLLAAIFFRETAINASQPVRSPQSSNGAGAVSAFTAAAQPNGAGSTATVGATPSNVSQNE